MPVTVLIVDDDADIRLTLSHVLRDEGFVVREARNGLDALEKIAEETPDVVLLDLMMPVVSGWEVLETLRSCRKEIPIIVVSAFPGPAGTEHIPKPISYGKLVQILDAIRKRVDGPPSAILVGARRVPDTLTTEAEPSKPSSSSLGPETEPPPS